MAFSDNFMTIFLFYFADCQVDKKGKEESIPKLMGTGI